MAKHLNTNFTINAPKPIDSRMQVATFAGLDAIPIKFNHMVTHVIDQDADYKYYLATNTWILIVTTVFQWGDIQGTITDQVDLMNYFNLYALVDHVHPQLPPLAHTHIESEILDLDKYTQEEIDSIVYYKTSFDTGLIKEGAVSINVDTTKFDIAAGLGIKTVWSPTDPYVPPTTYPVSFGPFTAVVPAYLATHPASYIGIAYDEILETASVVQSSAPFTPESRRSIIAIGHVEHSNNTFIHIANNEVDPTVAIGNQVHDLATAIGMFSTSGNIYAAQGTTLAITKSAGTIFKSGINYANPDNPSNKATAYNETVTFRYRLQDSVEYSDAQNIDPNFYDLNGVKTSVPAGKFTVPRIYLLSNNETRIQYGQTVYDSYLDAFTVLENEVFTVDPHLAANGVLRAFLIVQQGAIDLTDITTAYFIPTDREQRAIKPLQTIEGDKNYVHIQTSATLWTIPHELGKIPSVFVQDGSGNTVYGDIQIVDDNNITITFNTAFSGTAYLN